MSETPTTTPTTNESSATYNPGYYYGVLDIYYAVMTGADSAAAAPTYGAYSVMGKTIQATITPNYKEGKVYASNVATRAEKRVESYTVSLNLDQILNAAKTVILGRTVDDNGVQAITGAQEAPYVAIAFAITLDDGSKELWTLYKGKFSEPSMTAQTDSDSRTYQHPTVEATFVRREFDDLLATVADTADTAVVSTVETGWFTSVYEPDFGD